MTIQAYQRGASGKGVSPYSLAWQCLGSVAALAVSVGAMGMCSPIIDLSIQRNPGRDKAGSVTL